MSVIPTVTGLSSGARLLSVPRTLAAATKAAPSSLPSLCYLKKKGYYTLRRWSILPATRKLVIRAARTESKGVSLGFRAPNFELTEPLTGKVWKLEDFEAYPALLLACTSTNFMGYLPPSTKYQITLWLFRTDGKKSPSVCLRWELNLRPHGAQPNFIEPLGLTLGCAIHYTQIPYVMFICNHCPFVIHLKKEIVKLSNFYMKVGRKLIPFPFFSNFKYYMLSLLSVSSVVEKNRITSRSSSLLQKGLAVVAISSNSVVTHPQDGPEFMAQEATLFKYPFPYLYDEIAPVPSRTITNLSNFVTGFTPTALIANAGILEAYCSEEKLTNAFAEIQFNSAVDLLLSLEDWQKEKHVNQLFKPQTRGRLPSLDRLQGTLSVLLYELNIRLFNTHDMFMKDGRRPFELVYHGQFDDSRPSNNVPVTGRDLSLAIDRVLSGQLIPSTQKPSIKWNPGGKQ
ncbi:putative protein PLEKHA9-like [Capsicum annuum]|nr:putative protein PLEKHA9-like [Capsicum annuum]